MEQIAVIVIILLSFGVIFLFFRKKSSSSPEISEKSIEERYGSLPCDGTCCSKNDSCQKSERLFCRDVLSKILPKDKFSSQYCITLPSGNRRIDFAFINGEGTKVAIELDGFSTHAKNITSEKFDLNLKRQNELVCHNWIVLRFSFSQLVKGTQYCIDTIKQFIPDNEIEKVRRCDEVFMDVIGCDKETAKKIGLLYSGKRSRYFLPASAVTRSEIPPSCKIITWTRCPVCGEIAYQKNGPYGLFWACSNETCRKTFNDPKI